MEIKNNITGSNIEVIKRIQVSFQPQEKAINDQKTKNAPNPGEADKIKNTPAQNQANNSQIKDENKLNLKTKLELKTEQFSNRGIRFEIEDKLDIVLIKIIDKETEEVIRQIPPEEIIELLKNLNERGLLVDKEV